MSLIGFARRIRNSMWRRRPCTGRRSTCSGNDSPPTHSSSSAARTTAGRPGGPSDPAWPAASEGDPWRSSRRPRRPNGGVPSSPGSTAPTRRWPPSRSRRAEANRLGAPLEIVHAWQVPAGWGTALGQYGSDVDTLEEIHRDLLDEAVEFARGLGAEPTGHLETGAAADGAPEDRCGIGAARRREPRVERLHPVLPRIGQSRPPRRAACADTDRRPSCLTPASVSITWL